MRVCSWALGSCVTLDESSPHRASVAQLFSKHAGLEDCTLTGPGCWFSWSPSAILPCTHFISSGYLSCASGSFLLVLLDFCFRLSHSEADPVGNCYTVYHLIMYTFDSSLFRISTPKCTGAGHEVVKSTVFFFFF